MTTPPDDPGNHDPGSGQPGQEGETRDFRDAPPGWVPPQQGPRQGQQQGPPQGPPSGPTPGPGQGPPWQGMPPGQGPWGPPPPPPPSSTGENVGITIGMAFAGLSIYSIVNAVLGFFVFFAAMSAKEQAVPLVIMGTVALVVVGLVAGIALVLMRKPWSRGLGLGLMIGWALWSICTAGLCTGLNPTLYGG